MYKVDSKWLYIQIYIIQSDKADSEATEVKNFVKEI